MHVLTLSQIGSYLFRPTVLSTREEAPLLYSFLHYHYSPFQSILCRTTYGMKQAELALRFWGQASAWKKEGNLLESLFLEGIPVSEALGFRFVHF